MADAPAPQPAPNRALSMVLLIVTALGTLVFMLWGTWDLLHEERLPGFGRFFLGLCWFLFFSWLLRVQQRPWPPPQ